MECYENSLLLWAAMECYEKQPLYGLLWATMEYYEKQPLLWTTMGYYGHYELL